MKWSWRIGRVRGIEISIHATFPLLLAWVAIMTAASGGTLAAVLASVLLILAVFGVVVLHELGHALTAQRFGVRTRGITLLPIGGVAQLENIPREPRHELAMTLAGPAVNIAIALLLWIGLLASGGMPPLASITAANARPELRLLVAEFMLLNVWIAVFNLLPAFPLDGGRVLRAILAMRYRNYARATTMAARIGRVFALLFGLAGMFWVNSPFLVVIALFVWLAAATEEAAVQTAAALEQVPLADLMITEVRTLSPDDSLATAAQHTIAGFQQDFPVIARGELVGMLTQRDLVRGLAEHGASAPVGEVMRRDFGVATANEPAEEAMRQLTSSGDRTLPVVAGRQLLGVLTRENVAEYVTLQAAASGAR